MTVSRDFLEYVLDLLQPLGGVTSRRMFNSVGLFQDGRMFALISGDEQLYIKTDATSRPQFEQAGCPQFCYTTSRKSGEGKVIMLPYHAAPPDALDDRNQMLRWAQLGLDAAHRAPEPKRKKTRSRLPLGS